MFENKNYNRFKKIYQYITDKDCKYTKEFSNGSFPYKTFKTKMGDRNVISMIKNNKIFLAYHDFDNDMLFSLLIYKNGRIDVITSKIDDIAIFAAIYELECIIHNGKTKHREEILEKLFSSYGAGSVNNLMGYYWD